VLRNEPNVSADTREFVLRVAEKVGFQPSGRYRRNRRKDCRNYAILLEPEHSENDAFFSGIILSVQKELFARGFDCSFGIVNGDYAEFLKLDRILRSRDVRGILIVGDIPPHLASILQSNFLNQVFVDYPGDPAMKIPFNAICVDNVYGGHLALNHLSGLGRKRILLIHGREGHYFSNDLLKAYRESMADHRIEADPRLIVSGDFHVDSGFRAVKQTLEAGVKFDAVFSNDEMACGAIKALKEAGLNVPRDVSVVGFDGLPIGEVISPPLTTIKVDREKLGRLAVKRLLAVEDAVGDEEKFEKIFIFPQLLVRESCGATQRTT
jgi:LacI family transcriptional regulator